MAKRIFSAVGVAAAWLLLWQLLAMSVNTKLLLPGPWDTLLRIGQLSVTGQFWQTVSASMGRILLGWVLGVAVGVLIAPFTAWNRVVSAFLSPVMSVIKATPVASFVMLAFVWIKGQNLPAFCTFLMVMPIVWANVHQGLLSADSGLIEMGRAFRLDRMTVFRTIRLPALLPHLFGALRVSLGFAWKAGVAAEVIAHVKHSIGGELYDAKMYLETVDTFAWTGVVILLSVLLEKLCAVALDRTARRLGAKAGKAVSGDDKA